jgi:hypothetical protein
LFPDSSQAPLSYQWGLLLHKDLVIAAIYHQLHPNPLHDNLHDQLRGPQPVHPEHPDGMLRVCPFVVRLA